MKKLFTLIMGAVFALGISAQEEVDIPLTGWTWGWSNSTEVVDGVMNITITGTYGAASTGWGTPQDWSKYNKVCVVVESATSDWGKVYFQTTTGEKDGDGNWIKGAYTPEQTFGTISNQKTVTLNFDPDKATKVTQLAIQGKEADQVIRVSRVYLVEAMEYEEPKDIAYDEWGNILASEFDGMPDNAKVEFVVDVTGEATNADNQSILGWGIGAVKSLDGSVKVADLGLKQIGRNVYTFTTAELKEALEAPQDQYNRQGLNWNVWTQGNATPSRTSLKCYVPKGTTAINGITVEKPKTAVRYNIMGQPVNASYKGLVIENGRKYMAK